MKPFRISAPTSLLLSFLFIPITALSPISVIASYEECYISETTQYTPFGIYFFRWAQVLEICLKVYPFLLSYSILQQIVGCYNLLAINPKRDVWVAFGFCLVNKNAINICVQASVCT
jgi:hypothetical protein